MEGVFGGAVDEGVLTVDKGVLARAGMVAAGGLGGADVRGLAAVRVTVPVEVIDCPVCCGFRGVEFVDIELSDAGGFNTEVDDLAAVFGAGDWAVDVARVTGGLV